MASYTPIMLRGEYYLGLTVDDSVGIGGSNKAEDVALIQAMFRYILPKELWNWTNSPTPPPPEISGTFDAATAGAIIHYQNSRSFRLISFDGIIHAPSYGKIGKRSGETAWIARNLKNPENPLMMMTLMHVEAKVLAKHRYPHGGNYTNGMTIMFPQVLSKLKGQAYRGMSWLK